jgi:hypothetical protein
MKRPVFALNIGRKFTFSSNREPLKSSYKAARSKLSNYKERVVYIVLPEGVQPWRYRTLHFAIRNHNYIIDA